MPHIFSDKEVAKKKVSTSGQLVTIFYFTWPVDRKWTSWNSKFPYSMLLQNSSWGPASWKTSKHLTVWTTVNDSIHYLLLQVFLKEHKKTSRKTSCSGALANFHNACLKPCLIKTKCFFNKVFKERLKWSRLYHQKNVHLMYKILKNYCNCQEDSML